MSKQDPVEGSLAEEFRNLGENLAGALRTAWEHPERKRLQDEVLTGLNEFGQTLQNEADGFAESPTGQRLRSDVQNFGERIRSHEAQSKVRQELLDVLQSANSELQRVINEWSGTQADEEEGPEPEEADPEA